MHFDDLGKTKDFLSENKYTVIASLIVLLAIGGLAFYLGYITKEIKPHEIECFREIEQVKVVESQLQSADKRMQSAVLSATTTCRETETEICVNKIEDFKVKYEALRCQICERTGSR